MAKQQPETTIVDESPEAIRAALAEAQLKIAELEASNKLLSEGSGSLMGKFARIVQTTGPGKKKWQFDVKCPTRPELKPQVIDAIDETEAIRLYAITAVGEGKAIDTVKDRVTAVCKTQFERKKFNMEYRAARNADRGYTAEVLKQPIGGQV